MSTVAPASARGSSATRTHPSRHVTVAEATPGTDAAADRARSPQAAHLTPVKRKERRTGGVVVVVFATVGNSPATPPARPTASVHSGADVTINAIPMAVPVWRQLWWRVWAAASAAQVSAIKTGLHGVRAAKPAQPRPRALSRSWSRQQLEPARPPSRARDAARINAVKFVRPPHFALRWTHCSITYK